MKKQKTIYSICLLSLFTITTFILPVDSYIRKRYTIEEIVDACTNVVFGTITEVNHKRLTAKLDVDENLKGVSDFRQIQIRLDVGQGNHPKKLLKVLETGQPIILFYLLEENRIKSLAHVNGTWFQLMAQDKREKKKVWWGLTHIEIFLNGSKTSKRASTLEFQKELRASLSQKKIKLLFLKTKASESEYQYVSTLKRMEKHDITFHEVRMDDKMNNIDANILWVGYHALADPAVLFSTTQENVIKDFVKNGGVVIFSGQPHKGVDRLRQLFDLQQPLYTPESKGRTVILHPTSKAGKLFEHPNRIHPHPFMINATWPLADDRYDPLATTADGKTLVVASLKHGEGIYLITTLYNYAPSDVLKNQLLLENLIHFACHFIFNVVK